MTDPALGPTLIQFAVAYGCMLVMPGPNMLLVLRCNDGISASRPLMAAAGVACGATLASIVAASSAAALPTGAGFRAVSGVLVAILMLRAALSASRGHRPDNPAGDGPAATDAAPFLLGLGMAALNPVSVPYFASFFVSHACSERAAALTCMIVFAMAGLWFASLGLASARLSRLRVPAVCRKGADMAVAAILTGLAIHHLWMAIA